MGVPGLVRVPVGTVYGISVSSCRQPWDIGYRKDAPTNNTAEVRALVEGLTFVYNAL